MTAHRYSVLGYIALAVAIFCASVVFQLQQNRQNDFADQLARQSSRSCAAYTGAAQFWTRVLAITEETLKAPDVAASFRTANERYAAALRIVIARSKLIASGCEQIGDRPGR